MSDNQPNSPPSQSSAFLGLVVKNLLWLAGSVAGAIAGVIVGVVTIGVGGVTLALIGDWVFGIESTYLGGFAVGELAGAAGTLIGAPFGAFLPLVAIKEGEDLAHEKVLAGIAVIALLFVAFTINADTVFAAGWMGLAAVVLGVAIVGGVVTAAENLFRKKK